MLKPYKGLMLAMLVLGLGMQPIGAYAENNDGVTTTVGKAPRALQSYVQNDAGLSDATVNKLDELLTKFAQSGAMDKSQEGITSMRLVATDTLDNLDSYWTEHQMGQTQFQREILVFVNPTSGQYKVKLGEGWLGTSLNQDVLKEVLQPTYSGSKVVDLVTDLIGVAGLNVALPEDLVNTVDRMRKPVETLTPKVEKAIEKIEKSEEASRAKAANKVAKKSATKDVSSSADRGTFFLGTAAGGVGMLLIVTLSRIVRGKGEGKS